MSNKEIVIAAPKMTENPMEAYLRAKEKVGLTNQPRKSVVGPIKISKAMEVDSEP